MLFSSLSSICRAIDLNWMHHNDVVCSRSLVPWQTSPHPIPSLIINHAPIVSLDLKPDTDFQFTEFLCSLSYQRLVAQGLTMAVTFDRPPSNPPKNLGGVTLPSIPKGQVYSGMLMNRSALQGVALEGKIFLNGCGTTIVGCDRISKMPPTKQRNPTNVSQDLSSVGSQLQRMASDHAELLKKRYKNQEKHDQRA
jgi:hypothetical protein